MSRRNLHKLPSCDSDTGLWFVVDARHTQLCVLIYQGSAIELSTTKRAQTSHMDGLGRDDLLTEPYYSSGVSREQNVHTPYTQPRERQPPHTSLLPWGFKFYDLQSCDTYSRTESRQLWCWIIQYSGTQRPRVQRDGNTGKSDSGV